MKKIILPIIFSIIILSTFVMADDNGIWHLTQDIRPGTFGSDESTIGNYYFEDSVLINSTSGRGLTSSSSTDDGIMGESSANDKSAIYGLASNGAYSGYFEGGDFVVANSNVGIGTSNPSSILEISQPIIGTTLRITNGQSINNDYGDIYGGIEFYNPNANNGATNPIQGYIRSVHTRTGTGHSYEDAGLTFGTLSTDGSAVKERMRINYNGNIGIGTTTPSTKLEVVGGVTKTTGGLVIEVRTSNPSSPENGRMWLIN